MTRHYVTTASAAYLTRLKVLHASLRRHAPGFVIHVLAEGFEVMAWAGAQADVEAVSVADFLLDHPHLRSECLPGPRRNGNELACCWRWWFAHDVILAGGRLTPVLCIDADVMLFSSPEPVFEEIEAAGAPPAAVLPHAFPMAALGLPGVTYESHGKYSRFNGGFSFWAEPTALAHMAALTREHSRATDYTRPDGRVIWGDQGNLSLIHEEHGAHVIEHPGACLGPWAVHNHGLRVAHDQQVFFGGRPLVSYHFHAARDGRLTYPDYQVSAEQAGIVYRPYFTEMGWPWPFST